MPLHSEAKPDRKAECARRLQVPFADGLSKCVALAPIHSFDGLRREGVERRQQDDLAIETGRLLFVEHVDQLRLHEQLNVPRQPELVIQREIRACQVRRVVLPQRVKLVPRTWRYRSPFSQ